MPPGARTDLSPVPADHSLVDPRALECFVAVARRGHFTRAAEDLYLTQSAVSQAVARLEASAGVALLVRGRGGVTLTAAGEELLDRAVAILGDLASARAAMDGFAGVARGAVRIAAEDAAGLAAVLAGFHAEHPGIRVTLRSGPDGADLVIGAEGVPVRAEPMVVLGLGGEVVDLQALRGRALVLAPRGSALRALVVEACEAGGFGPVPVFEASEPAVVRALVGAGLGVAVVPASWAAPPLVAAPLAEPLFHQTRLWTRPDPSPATVLLRDHLLRAFCE